MLCALIMAGGKGERFWPLSTEEKPKQFLNLVGNRTMLQMTVSRFEKIIPIERIFIVTAKLYVELLKEQLPFLPERNIIIEPISKNTAPCIVLSAFTIKKYYNDATIVVAPSDHLIKNESEFLNTLCAADIFVEDNPKAIVTIGIRPDRPETGYGYIQFDEICRNINRFEIRKVVEFREKPQSKKAEEYIESGNYLWNSGMFVWKNSEILNLAEQYLSNTYNLLEEIAITSDNNYERLLEQNYNLVDSISIDYGIMERAANIFVIPSDFGWDDIGSWKSIERYNDKDEDGNINKGNCFSHKSSGNIIVSTKKVVLNNVNDLIIVETDKYILVSSKHYDQEIKETKKNVEYNEICID
jgi:mannose-1-phosphate guanylyltransferase